MSREFLQYIEIDSPVHRLDPRTKLVWLGLITALTMVAGQTSILLILLSSVASLFVAAGFPSSRMRSLFKILCLTAVTLIPPQTFFYWGFYYGKPVHVWFWVAKPNAMSSVPVLGRLVAWVTDGYGICACEEGFLNGVTAALKFSTVFLASILVLMTTRPGDIMLVMNKVRIPHKFAFTIMTALRFIPTVVEELSLTMRAQQARGFKLRKTNPIGTMRSVLATLQTMILNCVRRAEILSIAMETRAFGARNTRTSLRRIEMRRIDKTVTVTLIGMAIATFIIFFIQ